MPGVAQRKWHLRAVAIGATLFGLTLCGIGIWFARSRALSDPASRAAKAYAAGQWAEAAELARETLAVRKDDPTALRLVARASARLGRDAAAMAIYQRRLGLKGLEAEDHVLLGQLYQRAGRADVASRAWKTALDADNVSPELLDELARLCIQGRQWEEAILVTERLSHRPGWEAWGSVMLGTIRVELNNLPEAADLFRRALELNPAAPDRSHDPTPLRKLIARTFLRMNRPDQALPLLRSIVDHAPDPESSWLMSRVYLQKGDKTQARDALSQAGSYRAENPLEPDPGPFVGEARCEKCHAKIFRDSLASRHTQTYYRGAQLAKLPLPTGPMPDPEDPEVTHEFKKSDGKLREETRVGREVFDAVIDYAFGTADRYLTTVSRDATGRYRIARLSYYQTPEKKGWDRSTLDETHPTRAHPAEFQGQTVGVRDGLAKCIYCHVTNPRTGHDSIGPETDDRAIGCERCHGPGGNHIAALQAGLPDLAIVNPAAASPRAVTVKQCNDCHILQKDFLGDPDNPGWVRSQGVGWTRSRCNTESGGAFGCVTCHDPHKTASSTTTADYEAKCLTCHALSQPPAGKEATRGSAHHAATVSPGRICPVEPAKGCVACHMPAVRIDTLHTNLTDHYIRVPDRKN